MTAYVHQPYHGWSHEELPEQNDYQEVPTSHMIDHGSISFGRYACEPISWEKRSVFTFNRQQEELEKCKSHGLVSKKKAYFEEYYKKIRAMKALESQQTEIALDYSDVGSNKSQIEEAVPVENPIKVVENCREDVEAPQKNSEVNISVNQALEVSIEDAKQIDICSPECKEASVENKSPITKVEHEIVTKESKPVVENTSSCNVKMKSDQETLVPKVARAVRKHKDTTLITKTKEPSAPARNGLKLVNKAKLDNGKSTNAPKIIRKTDVKLVNGVYSSKNSADKVPKNNKSTAALRPFSTVTNKRVSNSSQGRELCSKTSNMKMSATVKGKEPINAMNNTSKRIAAVKNTKGTKTEAKRSSSLPRDRVRSRGVSGTELKPGFNVNKHEARRHESKAAEVFQADAKRFTSLGTTQASETKKIARSRPCGSRPGTGVQQHNSKKNLEQEILNDMQQRIRTRPGASRPVFGGQSYNARKNPNLELEKQRWR